MSRLIAFDGVFEPLRDPRVFSAVSVNRDLGTIVWPNGADLDPMVVYGHVSRARD